MPKYMKKPVVITAEQWFPGKEVDGVVERFLVGSSAIAHVEGGKPFALNKNTAWGVETIEGFMHVRPGDYIITGIKGEKYPCREDIFEETYEEVTCEEFVIE